MKIITALCVIMTAGILFLHIKLTSRYVEFYTCKDTYYVYPGLNKVDSESGLYDRQFNTFNEMFDSLSERSIQDVDIWDSDLIWYMHNYTAVYVYKDSVVMKITNPYTNQEVSHTTNEKDVHKSYTIYYTMD